MPSFPTSVYNPASKATGDTIQAAHVNNLDAEVNAIEDGYINGTARLNSSRSTVASLSVTGNSTLASSVTLGSIPYVFPSSGGSTGNVLTCVSTSGSTMGIEWRAPVRSIPDAIRVKLQSAVQVAANTTTAIAWTTDDMVTNSSMHSTTTNPSRLIPQSTGIYLCEACIEFRGPSTYVDAYLRDSSGTALAFVRYQSTLTLSANTAPAVQLMSIKHFTADGGWVRVEVQSAGSTASIDNDATHFSLVKL